MKNVKNTLTIAAAFIALGVAPSVYAEVTTGEKVQEVGQDAVKNTKKGYRAAKQKGCEMINGKMKCLDDKIKHGAQNAADEVSDKADDVKKKVN